MTGTITELAVHGMSFRTFGRSGFHPLVELSDTRVGA